MSVKARTWESGGIDENTPTLSYLQDIPVVTEGVEVSARTVWDGGSNRVLVNTEFAQETNLPEKTTSIVMNVVGGDKREWKSNFMISRLRTCTASSTNCGGMGWIPS